jgi:hypothetical protein
LQFLDRLRFKLSHVEVILVAVARRGRNRLARTAAATMPILGCVRSIAAVDRARAMMLIWTLGSLGALTRSPPVAGMSLTARDFAGAARLCPTIRRHGDGF